MASTIVLMQTENFRRGLTIIADWVASLWNILPPLLRIILLLWFIYRSLVTIMNIFLRIPVDTDKSSL